MHAVTQAPEGTVSIRATREAHGLSIAEAAEAVGVSESTLRRAEAGKMTGSSSPSTLWLIAAFCGIRVGRFGDFKRVAEFRPMIQAIEDEAEAVAA
jgi:transcriptional regulator with XRE-family HTH domain